MLCLAVMPLAGAADKSGVSPRVVKLPAGPGSVQGLGKRFDPDLATGASEYGFKIALPAGHVLPNFTIKYNSGFGDGVLGIGWELGIPFVERETGGVLPEYHDVPNGIDDDRDGEIDELDEFDRFVTETHNYPAALVPAEDGTYLGEVEGPFVRYARDGDVWVGTGPDGSKNYFGETAASRLVRPEDGGIFTWRLERVEDVHGNTVRYIYEPADDPENKNNTYLTRIEYGAGLPPWDNFHFVVFNYEARPSFAEDCSGGFCTRTGKRLTEIIVGTQGPALAGHASGDFNGDGTPDYLDHRYELAYNPDLFASLLVSVTEYGADNISAMPAMTFDYTLCDTPENVETATDIDASGSVLGSVNTPPRLFTSDAVEITELNGDGLPDILRTYPEGGQHTAYLNQGEVDVDGERVIQWSNAIPIGGDDERVYSMTLAEGATREATLADFDGDTRSDLALPGTYYFPQVVKNGLPQWGERVFFNPDYEFSRPPSPIGNDNVLEADINGDALIDIVQTSAAAGGFTEFRIWFNSAGERYGEAITIPQDFTYRFDDEGVDFTDFNGDDIDDVVRITPVGIEVAAGLGYGQFAPVEWVPLPEGFVLNQVQLEKAVLEDVTGSALPDLLVEGAAPGRMWFWLNLGGNTLSNRKEIRGLPISFGGNTATRWADMNGNGTVDYVFADDLADSRLQIVDIGEIVGCVPSAGLLSRIDNGIGSITTIEYETTTRFQLADNLAGNPWLDPIPFPIEVISRVATDDTLGNVYERTYNYHDGRYDYVWLLFIGYSAVEETLHSSDPRAPSAVRHLEFDVGRDEFNLRGTLTRETLETVDGGVFWDEQTTWALKDIYEGTDENVVVFPHKTARTRDVLEQGVGTPRRLEWAWEYDNYGNETKNSAYGIVEDGDRGAFGDERIEYTTYAINTDDWFIRNQQVFEVTDYAGTVQERTARFYDDETFAGDNAGEVTLGNETLTLFWRDTYDDATTLPSKRVKYDAYGNPVLMIDPLGVAPDGVLDDSAGHYRRIAYDEAFHVYPVEETVGIGGDSGELSLAVTYDVGHGTVLSATNFAGSTTTYGYDVFSRFVRSIRPGASEDFPSLEYDYRLAVPVTGGGVVNYVETRLLDRVPDPGVGDKADYYSISRDYLDGFGRKLQVRTEAEPATAGGPPRATVTDAVTFNGRGEVATTLQPFFTTAGAGTLDTLLAYEDIQSPGWQGQFHVDGSLVTRALADAPQTQLHYDALARVVETINPDGSFRTTAYEPMVEVESDENDVSDDPRYMGTPVRRWINGLERIARVEEIVRTADDGTPAADLATWTTIYDWAYDGQIARITDSQGNQKTFSYDGLGNRVVLDDMNQGQTTYGYDDAGNLVRTEDAMGRVITYTFDGANRIRTEDYHDEAESFSSGLTYDPEQPIGPDNQPDVIYYYDAPAGVLDLGNGDMATAQNTSSHLAYVTDRAGETHFSYDARGNRAWEVKRIADPYTGTLTSYTTAMAYDPMDRLVALTYPDGDQINYAYNARNMLQTIGGTANILTGADYNPAGQRTRYRYGNGIVGSYAYDARGRLTGLRAAGNGGGDSPIIDFAYAYDPASNVAAITDNRPDAVVPAGDARRNTQEFDYDTVYRLTSVAVGFQLPGAGASVDAGIDYRYDRIGNMVSKTSNTGQTARGFSVTNLGTMTYGGSAGASDRVGRGASDPPGPHALTGADDGETVRAFNYDARGNMTQMDDLALAWDYKDRLIAAEDTTMRAEYTYDYTDQRVVKEVFEKDGNGDIPALPTRTVQYIGKHFEVRDNDQPTKFVFADDDRIAKVTGTLDNTAERVQRLRIQPGWNLCTIVVDADDTAAQLGIGSEAILGAFLLDPGTMEATELFSNTDIPVGSLVWLNAAGAAVVSVRGVYTAPADGGAIAATGLFAYTGLERISLARALAAGVDKAWGFGALVQAWQVYLPGDLAFLSDLPEFAGPGTPVYLAIDGQAAVPLPEAAARIQFYHPDHLDSASVLTDLEGNVVEETAYWPFGEMRNQWRPSTGEPVSPNPYLFSQKERDTETNLQYFEARYLAASLGRFNRVDPAIEAVPDSAYENPQLLHAYAFAGNNPVRLSDPDGRLVLNAAGKVLFRQLERDKTERRATIFGDLQFKKGEKLPSLGLTLPSPFEREANKLKFEEALKPNELISAVTGVAEAIQSKFPKEGKNALNATAFFERLSSNGNTKENPAAFRQLFEGKKNEKVFGKAITDSGRIADSGAAKDISVLQNTLKSIDLDAKYKELIGKVNESGKVDFQFDQKQVDKFIDKYLPEQQKKQEEDQKERDDEDEAQIAED